MTSEKEKDALASSKRERCLLKSETRTRIDGSVRGVKTAGERNPKEIKQFSQLSPASERGGKIRPDL